MNQSVFTAEAAATIFKALGDETRLRVMMLVRAEKELCVCELTAALDQPQPKVSRHLAQLRALGLLRDRREGQWVFYRLDEQLPAWVVTLVDAAVSACQEQLAGDRARLQGMGERPQRRSACC